jgi:hypothetical protein
MRRSQTIPSLLHLIFLIALALLGSGCSQNKLLTSHDYENSQRAYLHGDTENALLDLPRGSETGTFINTMERGYLSLIQGKPQIKELEKQAGILESRLRYHVSREARNFFYVQTPEDYYASEHEVIWLHFLLSWGYSLQGKYEDACVEARISGSLLSLPWSPAGHFDDPLMRLFLEDYGPCAESGTKHKWTCALLGFWTTASLGPKSWPNMTCRRLIYSSCSAVPGQSRCGTLSWRLILCALGGKSASSCAVAKALSPSLISVESQLSLISRPMLENGMNAIWHAKANFTRSSRILRMEKKWQSTAPLQALRSPSPAALACWLEQ